ncbi:S1 RNA-binding domain-containing protein [Streptomyces sp. NPDC002809]|uniref:S1 RNA-binding domain-containing protein n=1 Tax=Streptomyces sp. NPDC002809 TaxID=3154433 RepID=UPI003328DC71
MDWQSESPELWRFLEALHHGDIMSGTVAAIEPFGVFVALDDGPDHPTLPGVGFLGIPELSWRRFDDPADVVQAGQASRASSSGSTPTTPRPDCP